MDIPQTPWVAAEKFKAAKERRMYAGAADSAEIQTHTMTVC